ncbi:T9SS type A sorting domain-containing protein [bacterium]|nr:T9SS type A sorting domain-containing protein [bacterium]
MRQCWTGLVLTAAIALTCITSLAHAQPTANDLSYFPVHIGDVWVYKVSSFSPHEPHWVPIDTIRVEITGDSLYPNSKRYFLFENGGSLRVDSTDGRVYALLTYPSSSGSCPDSTEAEVYNLTVDSTFQYYPCPSGGITGGVCTISPLGNERVGMLNLQRQQRVWDCWVLRSVLAQGIGICVKEGGGVSGNQHMLIYARINGTEYWPVELKSFTATSQIDNSVLLNWVTENEVQNHGFTVQRRAADARDEEWSSLAFVPARTTEGHDGTYNYLDHPLQNGGTAGRLQYRLLQHDFDGTVSYLPVAEVQLDAKAIPAQITLYPNPALHGEIINVLLQGSFIGELTLFDALGRELRSIPATRSIEIETDALEPGVYYLRASRENGVHVSKLLIH